MGSETMSATQRRYFQRGGRSGTNTGARKDNVLQTLPVHPETKIRVIPCGVVASEGG